MRNFKVETVSTNIRRLECRTSGLVRFEAKKYNRRKIVDTIEEAKKYVDMICIEMGRKQVYNSFKKLEV